MKRKRNVRKWAKKVASIVIAAALMGSAIPMVPQAEDGVAVQNDFSEYDLKTLVNPPLKQYTVSGSGSWQITPATRFVVAATQENLANERLAEVVALVNSELMEKGIPSSNALGMVYAAEGAHLPTDILVQLADVEDITTESTNDETYKIEIDNTGVVVTGASENAVLYGLRTIQALMITNEKLPYGTILDYPIVKERRLHVDCARKYISKDWFIRQIREMSYLKINTLQMHFSENMGFRIECETDPAIVSEEHLTKAEVIEILKEAKKYGVEVIPSFDSPGHVDQILRAHPEYGQVNSSGNHYASGLDVTNEEAVQYIYSLYDEYMELFGPYCTQFHIGGDEYMEFDRPPFTTQYQSVLNNYAVEKYGAGYTWKDAMAGYINDLAAYVYSKGFKPRIFNDGIYYGENSTPQKIEMHKYIGIDFWSQMSWNRSIANLQTFVNKGHTDIYNFNASFFYYVLRGSKPTDGREQHSFDYPNQDRRIYTEWTPGKFQENTAPDDADYIKGVSMGIWCDYADICTEDVIMEDIATALRAMAAKSWDTSANSNLDWEGFQKVYTELGNVAGFEKGSELPESGTFIAADDMGQVTVHFVDADGNKIKEDLICYGKLDDEYRIEAPEIYGYRLVSGEVLTGAYTEEEQSLTFNYELYCDKTALQAEIEGKLAENHYIAETYRNYKAAFEEAQKVYENSNSRQEEVDKAVENLLKEKAKVVSLDKYALYVETQYPYSEEGFAGGYDVYEAAVNEAKKVLENQTATSEEIAAALQAVLTAKAALQKPDGIVPIITCTDATYDGKWHQGATADTYAANKMIDNDENTKTWFAADQTVGAAITFAFPKMLNMSSVQVIQPADAGGDILELADVEISADNSNWTKVGELNADSELKTTFTFDTTETKYVRIILRAEKKAWYQIAEVRFTYEQETENTTLDALITEAEELDIQNVDATLIQNLTTALIEAQQAAVAGAVNTEKEETALRAAIDAIKNYVPATLEEIIVKAPVKTIYKIGEKLDLTGMTVTANYSDGKTKDVTEEAKADISKFDSEKAGTYTIIVSYEGKTASFDVTVEKTEVPPVEEVNKEALKKAIQEADDFKEADYTEDTWKAFTKALEAAKKIAKDEKADQTKVDEALRTLKMAKEALKPKDDNPMPEPPVKLPFTDVKGGEGIDNPDWYYDAVYDVYTKKLMTGLTDTYFGAQNTLVRAQFAVILYRIAGEPKAPEYTKRFKDVPDNEWYTDAVMWAASEGIIKGYENGSKLFGTNDMITREQMAAIMYRYAGTMEEKELNKEGKLDSFPDAGKVQEFAKEALAWCVEEKIIRGDNGNLNPQGSALRAECAAVVARFYHWINVK